MAMDRQSGDLAPIETVAVAGTVMPLAVSPSRRFLYAALRSEPFSVASFAIDAVDGRLAPLATAPLPDSMCYVVADATGRFLLSASYQGNKLAVSPIEADGGIRQPATQIVPTPPKAHSVVLGATDRFVYAASLGGDVILQFTFDAALGKLAPNMPNAVAVKSGSGPRHIALHPSRRFLYLINEHVGTIDVFAVDAETGRLHSRQTVAATPPGFGGLATAADLHLTPDGRFLYGSIRTTNTLAGFQVDAGTGLLTAVGYTPTEAQPRGFNIDSRGRFLLAAGQQSHHLTVYGIDPTTGALSARHRYAMGQNPNWVEIVDLA
jgi:6-phosphogluconolactonase